MKMKAADHGSRMDVTVVEYWQRMYNDAKRNGGRSGYEPEACLEVGEITSYLFLTMSISMGKFCKGQQMVLEQR
jgi:hypothetical protein